MPHVFGSGCSSSDVELSFVCSSELVVGGTRPAVIMSIVLSWAGGVSSWVSMGVAMSPRVSMRAHLGWDGVGVAVAPPWSLPLPPGAGVASRAVWSLRREGVSGGHSALDLGATSKMPCWAPSNKMKNIKILNSSAKSDHKSKLWNVQNL